MLTESEQYVDIRFTFKKFREEWEDGEFEEWLDLDTVSRVHMNGVTDDDLQGIGEHFAQMDSYRDILQNELPSIITDGYFFEMDC